MFPLKRLFSFLFPLLLRHLPRRKGSPTASDCLQSASASARSAAASPDHIGQRTYIGPTLGGVESIVEQPAALFSLNPEDRREAGLSDNLVRYALGIENGDDLIADLSQALARI
jgi:hypothetical protein